MTPERIKKKKTKSKKEEAPIEEIGASSNTTSEILNDLDDILDQIDDVLEENAEQFVANYRQHGGQ